MNEPIFEKISANHLANKKIETLCKKLIKKCSFNSGADEENLCHLAYWLYIYGDEENALAISDYTHNEPFPARQVLTFGHIS